MWADRAANVHHPGPTATFCGTTDRPVVPLSFRVDQDRVTRIAVALLKRFAFDKKQTAASGLCFCAHFIRKPLHTFRNEL